MIDLSPTNRAYQITQGFDGTPDCPLWKLCESVADDFVRACLKADDAQLVRSAMERDICEQLDFETSRAEALLDLALEVLHLRSEGSYQSEVTEIAYLIARVTGGEQTLCSS